MLKILLLDLSIILVMWFNHPFIHIFLHLLSEPLHLLLFSFVFWIIWAINLKVIHIHLISIKYWLLRIFDHHRYSIILLILSSKHVWDWHLLIRVFGGTFIICEFLVWKWFMIIYLIVCTDWLILGYEPDARMIRIAFQIHNSSLYYYNIWIWNIKINS